MGNFTTILFKNKKLTTDYVLESLNETFKKLSLCRCGLITPGVWALNHSALVDIRPVAYFLKLL